MGNSTTATKLPYKTEKKGKDVRVKLLLLLVAAFGLVILLEVL